MKKITSTILLTLAMSSSAFAFKILPEMATPIEIASALTETYDFEGIVKLDNCSGSIIRFSGQPGNANAYVLTNGHCIKHNNGQGYLQPGEVVSNKAQTRTMRVFDRDMNLFKVTTTNLVYATMTNTDAAIYELKETYDDIVALGIRSFDFDSVRPMVGSDIDIVSGYWDRGYRCYIDGFVHLLLEGDWAFTDAIRYSDKGCDTIGGTSGSPIVQTGTRVVIGINNTGNKDGGRCQLNNPCEQDEDGDIDVLKRSYGQQTYNFYTCLTPDFRIDLTMSGCSLPK
jgi:V8-like Glu-specific endopeptidase